VDTEEDKVMKKFCTLSGIHGGDCMVDPDKVTAIASMIQQDPTKPVSVVAVEGGNFMAEVLGTPEEIYEKLVQAGRLH
jgi:hypothetical protein